MTILRIVSFLAEMYTAKMEQLGPELLPQSTVEANLLLTDKGVWFDSIICTR